MAIEVLKRHYDTAITFVNDVNQYYKDCNTPRHFKTRAALLAATADIHLKTKTYLETMQAASKAGAGSGGSSAKAMSGFNGTAKKLIKIFISIETGLRTQQINSPTALRKEVLPNIRALLVETLAYAKKFVPADVQAGDMKQEIAFHKQRGSHRDTIRVLEQAAANIGKADTGATSEELHQKKVDKQAAELLGGYKKLANKLPSSLKGKLFSLIELPIVPYADFTLVTPKFLRTTGLNFSYIADSFVVLEDQYLLAFDYVAATTSEDGSRSAASLKAAKSTLNARKRKAEHANMQEMFVLNVLDALNKKSSEEFTLMSSHFEHCPHNGRIALAWIVPKRIQRMFARKGDMSNAAWGFPWDRNATSVL